MFDVKRWQKSGLPKPTCSLGELRPIRKATLRDEDPLFPAGTVLADLERVDADLRLEEEDRRLVVGEGGSRGTPAMRTSICGFPPARCGTLANTLGKPVRNSLGTNTL